jgi:hypothetical protein
MDCRPTISERATDGCVTRIMYDVTLWVIQVACLSLSTDSPEEMIRL